MIYIQNKRGSASVQQSQQEIDDIHLKLSRQKNIKFANPRVQQGSIHVYLRSLSRNCIFYNDAERVEFLKRCNNVAKKLNCKILAFVLMDNHIHLHIYTDRLNDFMLSLLRGYVKWYNKLMGAEGKLFVSPFGSSVKFSNESIVESIFYILCNPVKAGMVMTPKDYKWCSYKFHYNSYRNPLQKYIQVDTSFINNIYVKRSEFENAIKYYCSDIAKINRIGINEWRPETYVKTWDLLQDLLEGRSIYSLNEVEKLKVATILCRQASATISQAAMITHLDFKLLRKCLDK